ncbi:motility associated factor glycosyltransferase family protein [Lysinibacillus xylanilyticus]|uniref:motility associated factor glycosyltransferase family protein n=1 Tax=Lysinibacillus xylanilyticus TaxID=582475 RepID=UPI003D07BFCB
MNDLKINIETSRSGYPTLKINELYIHSRYNPVTEVQEAAKKNYKPHHLHVLYGYGLGYLAEELINNFQFNEPLLIIDPLIDEGLLKLKETTYKRVYNTNSGNFTKLSSYLSELGSYSNKVHVIIQQYYQNLFPNNLLEVLKHVKDSQIRELYNINTINLFSLSWQLNSFVNTKYIYNDSSLEELFNKYDAPVVIASGGPSLIKQLEMLKENRSQFILICAGTTINTLLKYGIYPDYVVSVDGGEVNYSHFKDINSEGIELLYTPTNNRRIRECFSGDGFVFIPSGLNSLKSYYEKNTNKNFPLILGGGSVAHYAFSIAKKITTGPICLIGQDLAYTNDMSHAEGNKGIKHYSELDNEVVEVESWDGGKVKSSDAFKTMINTFEQLQLLDPHVNEVYNCTEGGAKINLISQITFKSFIKKYCANSVKKIILPKINKPLFDFEVFYNKEVENYQKIIKLLKRGIEITGKEKGPFFSSQVLNRLSKIEKKLNALYIEYNVDSLLEPIIIKNEVKFLPKINESRPEEFERVKNYTITLYQDCADRIEEYIKKLKIEMG